jgi:hypothetical protein
MGLIKATPAELTSVGGDIAGLGPSITTLSCLSGSFGAAAEPELTADALDRLGRTWSTAAVRLEDDLLALGRAVQASAIAYAVTDQNAMTGKPG